LWVCRRLSNTVEFVRLAIVREKSLVTKPTLGSQILKADCIT
jgi:hypothetical protein